MRWIIILIAVSYSVCVNAQLHDAQWIIGPKISIIDFRNDTVVDRLTSNSFDALFLTSADICDEEGSLLYITNGIFITDSNGNTLLNGDSLSPCAYTDMNRSDGLGINQGALFIPKPGNRRYYYLFHFSNDTLGDKRPGTLYYSIIDKEGNGGLGEVMRKNIVFCRGEFREGGMTACKHANGRDYWVIMGPSIVNEFYKFLVTPDTILGPYIQTIGPDFPHPNDVAYSKFSLDGSKYVTATYQSLVLVMDFDRCSGEFFNPDELYNNASLDPVNQPESGAVSVEFSPDNRFVYVADRINLNQYDLLATSIQDSIEIYKADSNDFAQMGFLQLAPNGKLYASTWNGGFYFLHVVNKPDSLGTACGFIYGGQPTLSGNSFNLPNMINYKLGPLAGSGCDTITDVREQTQEKIQVRIQPNPADKYVYVEMPQQGNYELQLLNATGQLIDKKQTPQIDIFDTENLTAGIYFIQATDKHTGKQIAVQKVAVLH